MAIFFKIEGAHIVIPSNSISEYKETLAYILKETSIQTLNEALFVIVKFWKLMFISRVDIWMAR